jgi:hypothetical protein
LERLPHRRRAVLPALFALFAVVHAALWMFTLPRDGGPDEWAHVDTAKFIALHGRLPVVGDDGLSYTTYHLGTYAPHPPLPYIIAGGSIAVGRAIVGPDADPFRWARLPNLAWAALYGWSAALVGLFLFPRRRDLAAAFAALACGVPQVGFTFGYFASDALLVAASMWYMRALLEASRRPAVVSLGLAGGVVLASKLNGFALVFLGTAWLALLAPRHRWGAQARAALASGGLALLMIAPWLVHNALTYGPGEAIPIWSMYLPGAHERLAAKRALVASKIGPFPEPLWIWVWAKQSFESTIGRFGYGKHGLPPGVYLAAAASLAAALAGWIAELFRAAAAHAGGGLVRRRRIVFFWGLAVALVLQSLRQNVTVDFQPQGRYLFAGLAAYVFLGLKGWGLLAPRAVARMRWGRIVVAAAPLMAVAAWRIGICLYPR